MFRGNKSISGSNQPLIVVDGVPMMMNVSTAQTTMAYGGERDGGDAMSTINPDDIAQITLLKGASAAALYGAVAANGAIMITTKSAQSGKVSIGQRTPIYVVQRNDKRHYPLHIGCSFSPTGFRLAYR